MVIFAMTVELSDGQVLMSMQRVNLGLARCIGANLGHDKPCTSVPM